MVIIVCLNQGTKCTGVWEQDSEHGQYLSLSEDKVLGGDLNYGNITKQWKEEEKLCVRALEFLFETMRETHDPEGHRSELYIGISPGYSKTQHRTLVQSMTCRNA